ncbi:MAG: hypothetical protein ACRDQJ_00875 [Pseudonocardiaceae bacterium]
MPRPDTRPPGTRPPHTGTDGQASAADAPTCTVHVVTDGFYCANQRYDWRDELEIPAAALGSWLATGHVKLGSWHGRQGGQDR